MRKGTIFYYEFKRLIVSRSYLLLLAAVLGYCCILLQNTVICGTMYTAPFSPWTFCEYVSSVSPLVLILLVTLCARQFSPAETGAAAAINATPMPPKVHKLIRYGAIASAFLIAALLAAFVCLGFYWLVFDYTAFGSLLKSGALIIFPSAFFAFGAAMLLGSRKVEALYALLAIILIVGVFQISLPEFLDLLGNSVLNPLYEGRREFAFTGAFLAGRAAFIAAGLAFVLAALNRRQERLS